VFLLLILVAVVLSQNLPTPPSPNSYYGSSAICSNGTLAANNQWNIDDYSANGYAVNFTGQTRLCHYPFIGACRQLYGVVPCNLFNQACVGINSNIGWNNAAYHPEYTARVTQKPYVCLTKGAFMAPDSGVVFIAIVMFAWIILTIGYVVANRAFQMAENVRYLQIVGIFIYIPCSLLFFSYYYLNGILGFAVLYAAFSLFGAKRVEGTIFGFVFIFLGLFHVTFENGLGELQHQQRFDPVNYLPSKYQYENFCEGYYRGFFSLPQLLQGDFDNPLITDINYCNRFWLSAELFFMIFLELMLALSCVFAGGILFSVSSREVVVKKTIPSAAATEMQNKA